MVLHYPQPPDYYNWSPAVPPPRESRMDHQAQLKEFKTNGAPDALLETQERYRTLFDLAPIAVYSCDASGVIQEYNKCAIELWGRRPARGDTDERFCGSFKLYRPDGSFMPHEQCPMGDVLTGKVPGVHDGEVHIERPDGSRVIVIVNIAPLLDQRGTITGAINCFYDVTERIQAERSLFHLAAIVESSDDAIIGKDLDGIITTWDRGAERLFGYTAQETIGQPGTMLIPAERHNEEPGILNHIRHGETIDHYETIRCHKNGTRLDISLTVSPIIDAHGQIVGASKIARNITERKQAEQRLRESEERFRHLYDELEVRVAKRTEELTESQTRLRALAAELNLTEQRERQRLATDLHDYLGQLLSVSRMKLDQAKQQPLSPPVAKIIADLHEVTNKSLTYTRTLISQLSPVLPEFGLPMALHCLT